MKRFAAVAAALAVILAGSAAIAGFSRFAHSKQALTADAPTVTEPALAETLNLTSVKKIRLCIRSCTTSACSAVGGNITGGTTEIWYDHPKFGWTLNQDLIITWGNKSVTKLCVGDMNSPGGNAGGRVFARNNGVTLASGTGAETYLEGINYE